MPKRKYLTEEEIVELIKELTVCNCLHCECKKEEKEEEMKILPFEPPMKAPPEMKKPMPPKALPWWIRMWSK